MGVLALVSKADCKSAAISISLCEFESHGTHQICAMFPVADCKPAVQKKSGWFDERFDSFMAHLK